MNFTPRMQQVHLGLGLSDYWLTERTSTTKSTLCKLEHAAYEAILLEQCPASVWPGHSYTHGCPRPMLIDQEHNNQLVEFNEALVIAITDIIQRWLSDKDANFPGRMPLEPDEEQLLQVCSILGLKSFINYSFFCSGWTNRYLWGPCLLTHHCRWDRGGRISSLKIPMAVMKTFELARSMPGFALMGLCMDTMARQRLSKWA